MAMPSAAGAGEGGRNLSLVPALRRLHRLGESHATPAPRRRSLPRQLIAAVEHPQVTLGQSKTDGVPVDQDQAAAHCDEVAGMGLGARSPAPRRRPPPGRPVEGVKEPADGLGVPGQQGSARLCEGPPVHGRSRSRSPLSR
jgi:hypothetical protein